MNIVKIMKTAAFAAMMLLALSCSRDDLSQPEELQLEVNANNISGYWELVEWNGAPMADGTYVYLNIFRNDRTYAMYHNLDSFGDVPHVVSGSYYIDMDVELGAVIRGNYDHDSGDWAHRYVVNSLTADTMVWVAKDDESFVQVFGRIDEIPVEPKEN